MDFLTITSSIVTGIVSVAGSGIFFSIRDKKRTVKAKASQEETSAKQQEFQLLKDEVVFNREIAGKLREEYSSNLTETLKLRNEVAGVKFLTSRQTRKIAGLEKAFKIEIAKKKAAEDKICDVIECERRKPPLGSFSTKEYKIINEEE